MSDYHSHCLSDKDGEDNVDVDARADIILVISSFVLCTVLINLISIDLIICADVAVTVVVVVTDICSPNFIKLDNGDDDRYRHHYEDHLWFGGQMTIFAYR